MAIDELTHADHASQLGLLGDALNERGIPSELVDPNEDLPVTTLMVDLGAPEEGADARIMAVSIMPFDDDDLAATQLVQFYVHLAIDADADAMSAVERATAILNAAAPVGNFGTQQESAFFRYVLAMPSSQTFDPEMAVELVGLLAFQQEHFGDYLTGVAEGEILVHQLPALLAAT